MQSIFNNLVTWVYYKGNQDNETGIFMDVLADLQGMELGPQLIGQAVDLPNAENLASSGADANFAEPQEPGMDFNSMITSPGGMG